MNVTDPMKMRQHFHMHRQHVGAGLDERFGVLVGVRDHQMHVERHARHPLDRLHDRRADGDVRDEVAVHDVHMNQIGAAFFGGRDGRAKRGEVGRENRRRDADRCSRQRLTSSEIGSPAAIWNPADGNWRRTMPGGTPG